MRHRPTIAIMALCALAMVGPGEPADPPRNVEKPAAKVGMARTSAPALSLGINCLRDAVTTEGAPLLFEVSLSLDAREAGPNSLTISNPQGGWSDLLRIQVRNATGPIAGLSVVAAEKTKASITLSDSVSGHQWYALERGALRPGDYIVVAVLRASPASVGAWQGTVSSPACQLTVRSDGQALSRDESDVAALTAIRVPMFFGRPDSALATADRLLVKDARNPLLLEAKGDVLARAGRYTEAAAMYDSALAQVTPPPDSPLREPPELLLRKLDEAESRIK
ncbi:MAG TPA: hypothetical protein VJX91_04290 [Candidatus Eisenbacteria bacterium]|nr:hypothetical protein [Candidatus Eisenbacteria bacterium]